MVDPSVLPGFLLAVVLVSVAPGPDNAFIAAVALDRGPRAGILSAVGMALGMVVHVCAAALGLAVLLRAWPPALDLVRVAGGGYLLWLAWRTVRAPEVEPASRPGPAGAVVGRAAATNLTNPKVILFFAAFLPQFVRAGHGPAGLQLAILGLLFLAVGLVVDAAVGLGVGALGTTVPRGGRASSALTWVAALTFAGLGGLLLLETALA